MKYLLAILAFAACIGCTTTKTKGGFTIQHGQQVAQALAQPENPAGASKQSYVERTETIDPQTGMTVEVKEVEAKTEIGGAQDLANIIAKTKPEFAGRMMLVLMLAVGAWVAWRKEWPLVAACLALGGLFAFQVGPLAAYLSMGAAALVYVAYKIGTKSLP